MTALAQTPPPPYYAVIFTSVRTEGDNDYAATAARMMELACQQPGFLGADTARAELGITISYWADEAAIQGWKQHAEHRMAQAQKARWYASFRVRVARVEREYGF